MAQIIAVNSKGQKQKFSELAWKTLGKDKGDWTEISSQTVGNAAVKEKSPNMGPQKVGNKALKKEVQTVGNAAGKTEEELAEEAAIAEKAKLADEKYNSDAIETKKEPSDEVKAEFENEIKDLTRAAIKDLFDNQKPSIEYNNRANAIDLKKQLCTHFNWDLTKLQEAFA